jgi:hypothetical protein
VGSVTPSGVVIINSLLQVFVEYKAGIVAGHLTSRGERSGDSQLRLWLLTAVQEIIIIIPNVSSSRSAKLLKDPLREPTLRSVWSVAVEERSDATNAMVARHLLLSLSLRQPRWHLHARRSSPSLLAGLSAI